MMSAGVTGDTGLKPYSASRLDNGAADVRWWHSADHLDQVV
jgi:hypothetical protein